MLIDNLENVIVIVVDDSQHLKDIVFHVFFLFSFCSIRTSFDHSILDLSTLRNSTIPAFAH